MAGFDHRWIAIDRARRLAVLTSSKGGAVPGSGFGSAEPEAWEALHRSWRAHVAPMLAARREDLGGTFGGPYAVAFRDRAAAERLLAGVPSSWYQDDPTRGHVALVEDVPEELCDRIVEDPAYEGSVGVAFDGFEIGAFREYTHDGSQSSPYVYVRRGDVPDLEIDVGTLPAEVVARFVALPVSFAEAERIDLKSALGEADMMEPHAERASREAYRALPWWRRIFG